jgi:predicted acylesterase/phospholipase RssA
MRALSIYAGPKARKHIEKNGLQPADICTVPGAAGGPKGLILGPLDRFIFGQWLPQSCQPVHLVGASIGAWRMATACLNHPVAAFERLEHDYIHQHYHLEPGEKRPTAAMVSELFGRNLQTFYQGHVAEVLNHPRYKLHIVTSRGRHILGREQRWRTPLGYLGAFMTNTVHRKAMGAWLERVVFSSPHAHLPFATGDYRTRQVTLTDANFALALQASCSIPFVLQAIHNIPGGPPGAYWDGGITDYHLHLDYAGASNATKNIACGVDPTSAAGPKGLVLYPHFQRSVVPGWLDKHLKWRYKSTHFLDTMVLLAPNPEWVSTLPNGKLPDRKDFTHYGQDLAGRVKAWTTATAASAQLVDEFEAWLHRPDGARVQAL